LKTATRAWCYVLACFVISVLAFACVPHRQHRVLLPESCTARFLSRLKQERKKAGTFKGVGDLWVRGRGGVQQAMHIAWIGREPDDLRIEVLGMWAQPLITLLVRGDTFWAYIIKNRTVFRGKNTSKNVSRIIGIPIQSKDLMAVLSGKSPLSTFQSAEAYINKAHQPCVTLYGPRKKRRQEICFLDESSGTITKVTRFNVSGDLQYVIGFENFKSVGPDLIPFRIRIVESGGPWLSLDIKKLETQVPVPDQAFSLDRSHARTVDLDTDHAP